MIFQKMHLEISLEMTGTYLLYPTPARIQATVDDLHDLSLWERGYREMKGGN